MSAEDADLDAAAHRRIGVALYNHVWTLLELPDRSPDQDDEMIHAAHASCYHWSLAQGSTPINLGRGEWLCSRVYAVLGRAEPALWHARRSLAAAEAGGEGVEDWDLAAALESMARALAVAGDSEVVAWKARAEAALVDIADLEDREQIAADIASLAV